MVATGAKVAATEAVLAISAAGGTQAAECARLMNELHESKFRDIAAAIADPRKTVESGDNVYVTRNKMTAIVKTLHTRLEQVREDTVLESTFQLHRRFPELHEATQSAAIIQLKKG